MNEVDEIRKYVADNLPALAAEIIDGKLKAVLCDGKVRILAKMVYESLTLKPLDSLQIAEIMINRAALEYVVRNCAGVK